MMDRIEIWLAENGFGEVVRKEPVGGGCINNSTRLHVDQGKSLFLKHHDQAPDGMFSAEAIGLDALESADALRIPRVLHVEDDFILLEDLGEGTRGSNYWQELGAGLAEIHGTQQSRFGFITDNFCGSTPQENTFTENGFEFFANYRILKLASIAFHRSLLNRDDLTNLEAIAENLPRWIPPQTPVLIHGDLWSGNIHCDERGNPALIDPATYWGWAEAELAMTQLFGGFNDSFYGSYAEVSDMEPDWRERVPLYNLYHLLNHLLLFGGSYLAPIRHTTARFT
jgi:fructosamine-3-kinase